jgi:maltokinase
VVASRVLSGEQSNTSIIIDLVDAHDQPGRPVICKVFRVVAAGQNPDVSVQSALAHAGSRFVPEPVGAVWGEWPGPGATRLGGHLAFAQEFLPGVEDAWRVALAAATAGDDFTAAARALGVATAAVHRDLARAFPTLDSTPEVVAQLCASMRERFRLAADEVPELAEHGAAIEAVFAAAEAAPWPRLQRIHGDYHLGQVLDVPGRGWVLIDFEGEPLRPLAERSLPDIPLRDVAGMLRSFSYVGATIAHSESVDPRAAIDWAMTARTAFLKGYHDETGASAAGQEPLLAAFELDKAIYESVYESRNRPSWLMIPLLAVRRLAGQSATAPVRHPL